MCDGTERLNLVQELDAETVDEILHTKRKPEQRCTLACDFGVKQDQGEEYAVYILESCRLDIHDEYEQAHPDDPVTGTPRSELPGARIDCVGTSYVQYEDC